MIYLDNAATTKPSAYALEKARKYNEEYFFNPSALYHGGINVKNELKQSREKILNFLSTTKHEVVFCSCGTEADNTALFGFIKRGTLITTEGEHSAVFKSANELKARGHNVIFCKLLADGSVDENDLYEKVEKNKPSIVSVVHVNNETGAINDIAKISRKIKQLSPKTVFHSDGVQAFGKIKFALNKEVDLYSVSAHKIGGLKGVGALIKEKSLTLPPFIFGGGQENGLRSGTENVFGIKTFEYALEERATDFAEKYKHVTELKERAFNLLNKDDFIKISGENSSPYILTVSAKGIRGEVVMHELEKYGIIVGNGSACSSKNRYSRIVSACGYGNDVLDGLIRISFSPDNTMEEVEYIAEKLNETVNKLKKIML